MKKILLLLLCMSLLFAFCACNDSKKTDDKTTETSAQDVEIEIDDDYQEEKKEFVLTEEIAKERAAQALYLDVSYVFKDDYDPEQTRYSIGSVSGSSESGYTVNGKYSLYDKYGNYKKSYNFTVRVRSDGYAEVTELLG